MDVEYPWESDKSGVEMARVWFFPAIMESMIEEVQQGSVGSMRSGRERIPSGVAEAWSLMPMIFSTDGLSLVMADGSLTLASGSLDLLLSTSGLPTEVMRYGSETMDRPGDQMTLTVFNASGMGPFAVGVGNRNGINAVTISQRLQREVCMLRPDHVFLQKDGCLMIELQQGCESVIHTAVFAGCW
ncbi:hypothetical protein NE237_022250 [Protea cynaroides]|uniref:Uncharacterized protein n=1 Tax=Protea cynaroides TaxID=273540 RepID=A0A9Q0K414_9MAGN|nr:hypothetical protein NE237_022250 [Protea cynaroides]